jgi:hypothetical protein
VEHGAEVVAALAAQRVAGIDRAPGCCLVGGVEIARDLLELPVAAAPERVADARRVLLEPARGDRPRQQPCRQLDRLGRRPGGRVGKLEPAEGSHIRCVLAGERFEALGLRGGVVRRRSHQVGLEDDLVTCDELAEHLRGEVAVRVVDLVEVEHAVRRAADPTVQIGEAPSRVARARMGERRGEQGGEFPLESAHCGTHSLRTARVSWASRCTRRRAHRARPASCRC